MPAELLASATLPPGSHEDRSRAYRAFLIFLTVLVTLALVFRFWSRSLGARQLFGWRVNKFWWDDWVAFLAVCFIWVFFGLAFTQIHLGFGRHIWMVPPKNLPIIFELLYAIYFLYDISLFLTKLSALLFLSRVFTRHSNSTWWNYALWATYGLNFAWLIGIVVGTVFMCDPVQKGWNPMMPGKCGTTSALWTGSAIPSVFIDLIILMLPVPKIWSLRISRARKAGILIVFVLGYLVIIVSLGRMITVLRSAKALNEDITYEGMPMVYWVTCEAPVTLISICLPPMVNLLKRFNTSFLSPLSSRIASIWSTQASTSSSFKSRDGTFATTLKSADGDTRKQVRSASDGGDSMESRSNLVGNTVQTPAAVYKEDFHIPLSNMANRQDQYLASVEGGLRDRITSYSTMPSQQIRVHRGVTVTHQP